MSEVSERLRAFISYKDISVSQFERTIGVSTGFVNNISKGIGSERMMRISQIYPELSCEWLLYGEGDMLKKSQVINGNGNCAVNGDHSVAAMGNIQINNENTEILKERIKHLEEMIAEKDKQIKDKELLIQLLMNK